MNPAAAALVADPAYRSLKSFLIEKTGLAYYETRDAQLAHLLASRIRGGCTDYLGFLRSGDAADEIDRLVCDLTIGETYFFRHGELFAALRDEILPGLLRGPELWPVRVWSAGCSIGAEAYSVSILLRRDLDHLLGERSVTILGTDINHRFLRQAEEGAFNPWALRTVSPDTLATCFQRDGSRWRILPRYREGVTFRRHNLAADPYPADDLTAFDVIFCRNVMIYFEPAMIHRILRRLRDCLVPGGWLLVGHAEPGLAQAVGVDPVHFPGAVAFRRTDGVPAVPAAVEAPARAPAVPAPPPKPGRPRPPVPTPAAAPPPVDEAARMRAYLDRGELSEGIALCDRALQRRPFDTRAYYFRALALEQMGRRDEAERDLRRVLYLDRSHALAHFQLARLLLAAGRAPAAQPLLRTVFSLVDGRPDEERAGEATDLTVRELRALALAHAGERSDF